MELKSTKKPNHGERTKTMEAVIVDGVEYNFGTLHMICHALDGALPNGTIRITNDPALREMLLQKQVVASTEAYPVTHSWCRFRRGQDFEKFSEELRDAEQRLEAREPLTQGESWCIDPAEDAAGERSTCVYDVNAQDDGTLCLWMDTDDEPYSLAMLPEVAEEAGQQLHALVTAMVEGNVTEENEWFAVKTTHEEISFDADYENQNIRLSGEGWGMTEDGEWDGSGWEIPVAEAEDVSWRLRELGAHIRSQNPSQ
jgi:hypothetical protein